MELPTFEQYYSDYGGGFDSTISRYAPYLTLDRLPQFHVYSAMQDVISKLKQLGKDEIITIVSDILVDLKGQGIDIPDDGDMNEGILGNALGLASGALAGPAVGKAVAKGLGIDKGTLYDLLTSRLVGAAIGKELMRLI